MLKKNEIPKLMINASSAFQTKEEFVDYIEYVNALLATQGKEEFFGNTEIKHNKFRIYGNSRKLLKKNI